MNRDEMRAWILNEVDAQVGDGSRSLETEAFIVGYRVGTSHGLVQFGRAFDILTEVDELDIQRRAEMYETNSNEEN